MNLVKKRVAEQIKMIENEDCRLQNHTRFKNLDRMVWGASRYICYSIYLALVDSDGDSELQKIQIDALEENTILANMKNQITDLDQLIYAAGCCETFADSAASLPTCKRCYISQDELKAAGGNLRARYGKRKRNDFGAGKADSKVKYVRLDRTDIVKPRDYIKLRSSRYADLTVQQTAVSPTREDPPQSKNDSSSSSSSSNVDDQAIDITAENAQSAAAEVSRKEDKPIPPVIQLAFSVTDGNKSINSDVQTLLDVVPFAAQQEAPLSPTVNTSDNVLDSNTAVVAVSGEEDNPVILPPTPLAPTRNGIIDLSHDNS